MRAPFTFGVVAIVALAACGASDPGDPAFHANGDACRSNSECASGHCSWNRVCCDTECLGDCQDCNLPDTRGTCTPLPARTSCDDGDACTGGDTCDGNGACISCTCDGRCVNTVWSVTCPGGQPAEARCNVVYVASCAVQDTCPPQ